MFVAPLFLLGFVSGYLKSLVAKPVREPLQAAEINGLALSIRNIGDARHLIDCVASIFASELLPGWTTAKMRNEIAAAELAAVSDQRNLVPEERLARAWNEFVKTVGASREMYITSVGP